MEEKDRLTNTSIEDVRNNLDAFDIIDWEEDIFNKLAEYEKTGLEPEEVEQLKKENEELKSAQNKVAIEKLEEVLDFIYSNKWTNIELCVDNSPLKIIRNELYTMIAELKGEKDE